MRRAHLTLLALVLAGVARVFLPPAQTGVGTEYTIVAPLFVLPDHPIIACWLVLSSSPPAGCGGARVRNIDVGALAGMTGGYAALARDRLTPSVRLVGTWDGHALTLTRWPVPDRSPPPGPSRSAVSAPSATSGGLDAPDALDRARRIAEDQSLKQDGVQVLETAVGTHGKAVDVQLVVADAHAVQVLQSRYPDAYVTGGWLQPLT